MKRGRRRALAASIFAIIAWAAVASFASMATGCDTMPTAGSSQIRPDLTDPRTKFATLTMTLTKAGDAIAVLHDAGVISDEDLIRKVKPADIVARGMLDRAGELLMSDPDSPLIMSMLATAEAGVAKLTQIREEAEYIMECAKCDVAPEGE